MARKPRKSNIEIMADIVRQSDRQREATRAATRNHMNKMAARRLLNNAAILHNGITENAARGILPVLAANAQRQRRGRR
jgi:hypothetical protein